jgi:TetR/AcrR family transcriptional regulator, mexJK operon transcriptional repressor
VIAAEAGVSKQTIYNRFGDKEALFREVVRAARRDLGGKPEFDELTEQLAASDNLARDLGSLARHWVAMVLAKDVAALRRLVIAEWDRHPWLLEEWEQPGAALKQALTTAFAAQAERGALDIDDADLAARQLLLLVITEALTRALYGKRELGPAEVDEIVDGGVGLWLRGHSPRHDRD